ncbi:MAG: ATP-binding protein [Chloroflexota bacterium]
MIVERLKTRHFRQLGELDLELGPGLTVIRGPNEAGKSSIVAALLLGLFTRASSASKDVVEQRCWDDDQAFAIELAIRDGDTCLELVKDFAARTQTLRDRSTDQVVKDGKAIEDRLTGLLGCPTQAFYESTACVKHDELAAIDKDRRALPERLQQIVTGPGDANVTAALASLNGYRTKLDRGLDRPARSPGLVQEARQRVAALTRDRDAALAALSGRRDWRQELGACRARLQTDRAEQARVSRLKQENADALDSARRLGAIGARFKVQKQIDGLKEKLDAVDEEIGPLSRLADAAGDAEQVQDIAQQIKGLESVPTATGPGAAPPLKRIALPVAILLVVVGTLLGALVNPAGFALVALGIGGVAVYLALPGQSAAPRDPNRSKIDELQREAERIARADGFVSPGDFLDAHAGDQKLRERRQTIEIQLGQLLGGEPTPERIARFKKESEALELGLIECRRRLRDLETADLRPEIRAFVADSSPGDLAARQVLRVLDEQISALDGRIAEADTRETQLGALLDQAGPTGDEVDGLEERLSEATERKVILERRLEAVRQAIATIDEAKASVMTSVSAQIQPVIGERLARVTAGRYSDARVRSEDLDVTVARPGTDQYIAVNRLSHGTRDQVYLAARLALVDRICNGRQPPLIVDDALASFDDERACRMLDLLRDFARGRQVLLLTWSARYDLLADRVVDLPACRGSVVAVG